MNRVGCSAMRMLANASAGRTDHRFAVQGGGLYARCELLFLG